MQKLQHGIASVYSNRFAFAAVKANGCVVTWGDKMLGGDSSTVSDQLSEGVDSVYHTETAFAALKDSGAVVTWGRKSHGGDSTACLINLLQM